MGSELSEHAHPPVTIGLAFRGRGYDVASVNNQQNILWLMGYFSKNAGS
jgi:hypothetical protein